MNVSQHALFVTNKKLLELLVCPVSGCSLRYQQNEQELWSLKARLAYPIRSGVPIMLRSEARVLEDDELNGEL